MRHATPDMRSLTDMYGLSTESVTCLALAGGCQGAIVSWRIHLAVATKGDYFQCLLRPTSEVNPLHCLTMNHMHSVCVSHQGYP